MKLLRKRNFAYFYYGCLISNLGSVLCNFGTSLFLLDLSQSAVIMSVYLAYTSILGLVLAPIMGTFVDRMKKVKTIYICDFIFGITDLGLAIILFLDVNQVLLWVCIFLNATINTIVLSLNRPASDSIIPMMMKDEELNSAYSLMSMMYQFVSIFGLIFAATLYALFSYKVLLIINSISFIICAIFEIFIKVDESKKEKQEIQNFKKELMEGFHYLLERKELVALAKCSLITNIFLTGIVSISLPFMINNYFGLHPMVLASSEIALALGGILIAMYLSKKNEIQAGEVLWKGFATYFFVYLVLFIDFLCFDYGLIPMMAFWVILFIDFIIFGISLSGVQIPLDAAYAKRVDSEYMGRIMSIRSTLALLASPMAMIVFGFLVDFSGLYITQLIGIIGMFLSVLYTYLNKHIRNLV